MQKELTAAEKAKPYAKYFYQPMAPAPKETMDILAKGPIDPAAALPIHQRNEILKPGNLPTEISYCVMPDNSGHVSCMVAPYPSSSSATYPRPSSSSFALVGEPVLRSQPLSV
jgi:hypothetical protein